MTGLAEQLNDSAQDAVGDAILEIMRDTMLSQRAAAKVLGISHGSLIRWTNKTNTPFRWTAEGVMHRIHILREADAQGNLFKRISVLQHRDRIDALLAVISDHATTD